MRQRLVQDVQMDNSSSDTVYLTSLLTETLLFSASEEHLTDWFEFLASYEPLRISICYEPMPRLLEKLLPDSIVRLARQKLKILRSSSSGDLSLSSGESKEFSEEEYWCMLYAYGPKVEANTVTCALEELKLRKPDSTGTFPILSLALSGPNQFLAGTLANKKIQGHLFSQNGKRFVIPIYEGEDVPSYDTLMSSLPLEIVGSFLCRPDRQDNLSRWGKELMEQKFSILQGTEGDSNSVEERQFGINREVLEIWAEQNESDFLQLTNEYLTMLSKSPRYSQALGDFTDAILCLFLRFQPDEAMKYYRQWSTENFRTVYSTHYGISTFVVQLWQVEHCNSLEHRHFRRELLEECLNDEEIMFMTLAALAGGGEEELWNLVTQEYLVSPYAKERNMGVSILPWFGTYEAINLLDRLKSNDPSQWVLEHTAWAYEVAQQERSCRVVYREALQTRDLFRISAVFEQMEPALSPTARWWHYKIEDEEELYAESQEVDPKLLALVDRFWYHYGGGSLTKGNIEIFGRKLGDHYRGEKIPAGSSPLVRLLRHELPLGGNHYISSDSDSP